MGLGALPSARDERVLRHQRRSLPAKALLSQAFPVEVLVCHPPGAVPDLLHGWVVYRRLASDLGRTGLFGLLDLETESYAGLLSVLLPWTVSSDRCDDRSSGDLDLASSAFRPLSSLAASLEGRTAS